MTNNSLDEIITRAFQCMCEGANGSRQTAGADDEETSFQWVRPESSLTLHRHRKRFEIPAITVPAYLSHRYRPQLELLWRGLRRLRHSFVAYDQVPHTTVLSVLHQLPALSDEQRSEFIHDTLAPAVDSVARRSSSIHLELNCIRLGQANNLTRSSDGSVFLLASAESSAELLRISDEIRRNVIERMSMSGILPIPDMLTAKRTFPAAWVTLGYFDEPDFSVDGRFIKQLATIASQTVSVMIDDISITEFSARSLGDGYVHYVFPLRSGYG